jgi:short-subunit dehydrogenase
LATRPLPDGFEFDDWPAGKAALITGGSTGIGRALAILLGSRGARVLICGRHQRELDETLEHLAALGIDARASAADISKTDDVEHLFQVADEWMGGVDLLVSNAGLPADDVASSDVDSMTYVVSTNLLGAMYCTHHALARMRQRRSGAIVIVGSMSADVREQGSSVYVATKAGLQGFAGALRKEVNGDGIRVVLVEPGSVGTDMNEQSPQDQRRSEDAGEMLKAEDVALVILGALCMPARADVVEVAVRPRRQLI